MVIAIRAATEQDVEAISRLLGEVAAYYGGDNEPADQTQIHVALFAEPPAATVLLAVDGTAVVGLASFSRLWPAAGAGTSMYLKELFVADRARRQGVGAQLLDAVRQAAAEAGCSRLEWTGDTDNPKALAFYQKLGVPVNDGKVCYRLSLQSAAQGGWATGAGR
jgi:GNAT superfamily N-acetyltransferase